MTDNCLETSNVTAWDVRRHV